MLGDELVGIEISDDSSQSFSTAFARRSNAEIKIVAMMSFEQSSPRAAGGMRDLLENSVFHSPSSTVKLLLAGKFGMFVSFEVIA
jgi:hypothetical protein